MANFFGSGPLPDWKEIRNWLGNDIPWHLVDKWEHMQDGDWMDRFIGGLASERREGAVKPASPSLLKIETIKQEKKIIVSFQLPRSVNLHHLRIYALSDRLRITGLPDGRTQSVHFPCIIYPKSGKAAIHDRKVTVEFRRRPVDQEEVELFIRS